MLLPPLWNSVTLRLNPGQKTRPRPTRCSWFLANDDEFSHQRIRVLKQMVHYRLKITNKAIASGRDLQVFAERPSLGQKRGAYLINLETFARNLPLSQRLRLLQSSRMILLLKLTRDMIARSQISFLRSNCVWQLLAVQVLTPSDPLVQICVMLRLSPGISRQDNFL